jgi:hypothetical protein
MREPCPQHGARVSGQPSMQFAKGILMNTLLAPALLAAILSMPLLACGSGATSSTGSTAAAESKRCRSDERPAACPGGGEAKCSEGEWECAALPTATTSPSDCDPSQEPAACPGGGSPQCSDGQWACAPLPTAPTSGTGCDPSQEPAACPGGGSPQCSDGQWACASLPTPSNECDPSQEPAACPGGGSPACTDGQWECAPLPSCVPDGQQSQAGDGSDCCSGNYDASTNDCGN